MPDIQTALKNALSKTLVEWDDDGEVSPQPLPSTINTTINNSVSAPSQNSTEKTMQKHLFPIRNNVTRETFNYIKNNPGSTRKEIIIALEHIGFKEASTSSIMSQLCRTKQAHTHNGGYYVDVPEYIPIKNIKTLAKKVKAVPVEVKAKRKYEKKAPAGIGALLRDKLMSMPEPSKEALDAAMRAMEPAPIPAHKPKQVATIVRAQSADDIIKNLTVFQARDLYDRLKEIFGG